MSSLREGDVLAFLKEITPMSHRWRSLWMSIFPNELEADLQGALETEGRALRDIALWIQDSSNVPLLQLPGTATFGHVSLSSISLPWDSPRLCNLSSLELQGLQTNAPTIEDLHQILSSSSRLERLSLSEVMSHVRSQIPESPCTLPLLTSLCISQVSQALSDWVLCVVERSPIQSITLVDIQLHHFQIPDEMTLTTFQQTVYPALHGMQALTIASEVAEGAIEVFGDYGPLSDHTRVPWLYSKRTPRLQLRLQTATPMQDLIPIAKFIAASKTKASITIHTTGCTMNGDLFESTQRYFPLEVLDILPDVQEIGAMLLPDASAILQYLAEVRHDEAGVAYNPCRRLRILDITEVQGLQQEDLLGVYQRTDRIKQIYHPVDVDPPVAEGDIPMEEDGV